ncbi:hypothetical protein E2C01_064444 [Portunus trituberculatus]|uniref:Uncharacterized protein n=1 Tax=Portunus trituberculatus TaxID=210409 RepID=A0A5B7HG76_PORTR|nr:hypothetical protein [Portunus trituberculatus]
MKQQQQQEEQTAGQHKSQPTSRVSPNLNTKPKNPSHIRSKNTNRHTQTDSTPPAPKQHSCNTSDQLWLVTRQLKGSVGKTKRKANWSIL